MLRRGRVRGGGAVSVETDSAVEDHEVFIVRRVHHIAGVGIDLVHVRRRAERRLAGGKDGVGRRTDRHNRRKAGRKGCDTCGQLRRQARIFRDADMLAGEFTAHHRSVAHRSDVEKKVACG